MKKVNELINAIEELGFSRDYAWKGLDESLDSLNPNRPNEDIENEEISDELYNDILNGFTIEKEVSEEREAYVNEENEKAKEELDTYRLNCECGCK